MAAASSCSAGVPTANLSQRRKATKGETAKIAKIAKGQQQRKAQTGLNSHEAWQPPDAAGVPSEIEFCKKQSEVFSDLMEGGSPATLFFAKHRSCCPAACAAKWITTRVESLRGDESEDPVTSSTMLHFR